MARMIRRRKKTVGRRRKMSRVSSARRAPRRKTRRTMTRSASGQTKMSSELEVRGGAGRKAGNLRTRRSAILWKPRGSRSWYNVRLDYFNAFMSKYGKRVKR